MRDTIHPPWNRVGAALIVLAWALSAAAPVRALTAVPRSFAELVQRADTVIVGTVSGVQSELVYAPTEHIVSHVTLGTVQVIKGPAVDGSYTLDVPGGTVGRYAEGYPGLPVFRVGRRYVLFVRGNRRDFFPVVGVSQGVFRVIADATGRQVVVPDDAAAQNPALSALTATAPSLDRFIQDIETLLPPAATAQ